MTHPVLETRKLAIGHRGHGNRVTLARDLDLAIQPGAFVCLLGPNGSGKSTLIRTLCGMRAPMSGECRLHGVPLDNLPPRRRARNISVVLTEIPPFGMMDAYSLVALGRHPYSGWLGGLSDDDHRSITAALDAVRARKLADRPVAELSDGERQRIAIARALAQEATFLLLDEPTAFLDLPRRVELMTLLRDLSRRREMGILLATHDLDLALRFADRLWLLGDEGRLVDGYPEALALGGKFAEIFASGNLDWDHRLGAFRAHREPCLKVDLQGEGPALEWTRRALERLGFGVAKGAERTAMAVRVYHNGTVPNWELRQEEQAHHFTSIAELIAWVENRIR